MCFGLVGLVSRFPPFSYTLSFFSLSRRALLPSTPWHLLLLIYLANFYFASICTNISGRNPTASLQIPYLISLAVLLNTYLPDFPFSARATFKLIKKLDTIFASLLLGKDLQTGNPLPGFEGKLGVVSMTEKVRIKSIAESTRIIVVSAQGNEDGEGGVCMDMDDDDDDDGDADYDGGQGGRLGFEGFGDELGKWEMESGRVYERTIQILGDELGKQDG